MVDSISRISCHQFVGSFPGDGVCFVFFALDYKIKKGAYKARQLKKWVLSEPIEL